jgi:penicillin-binding protein 1C
LRLKYRLSALAAAAAMGFAAVTYQSLQPFDGELDALTRGSDRSVYYDRHGAPLNITYDTRWNLLPPIRLHQIPHFFKQAFLLSEDQHFYRHGGVDWPARASALVTNVTHWRALRGASTITEQVVRMIHPRPRNIWSRWIEGFEASELEQLYSKADIFEFYLNQVPYRANRRGIVQASRYYFGRDVTTLNRKEMLALVVLVRSPEGLDPEAQPLRLERSIKNLADRLHEHGHLPGGELEQLLAMPLEPQRSETTTEARHFIRFVQAHSPSDEKHRHTTLDATLQTRVQEILDSRLDRLSDAKAGNGAVLVIDHASNEVLAWTVGYAGRSGVKGNDFDTVTVPRQPGSALKPFVYAKAVEKGWSLATVIEDAPLVEGVGAGMHAYKNYSHRYYGPISVREALGNSLNVPAVKAVQYVGAEAFIGFLKSCGITSYDKHPNYYGDGIVPGNSELSLLELVQAYTTLARMGDFMPIRTVPGQKVRHTQVLSSDIASLIADVLSDPYARQKEFSLNSVLHLPYQTAVKTGTSSDYRDAWIVGYDHRYTVGVWFGNLDYTSMDHITGAKGPAHVLRSVFSLLNKRTEPRRLYRDPTLVRQRVCQEKGMKDDGSCDAKDEWFLAARVPKEEPAHYRGLHLRRPTPGLMIAMDPRIPDEVEYFRFALSEADVSEVRWIVNGVTIARTHTSTFDWKVARGTYELEAEVRLEGQTIRTPKVAFSVH